MILRTPSANIADAVTGSAPETLRYQNRRKSPLDQDIVAIEQVSTHSSSV